MVYSILEQTLIKACEGVTSLKKLDFICDYYKDLQKDLLRVQLQTLMVDFYTKL